MSYTIQPWLSVHNGIQALEFYKLAFDAIETYRLDAPGEMVVARLSVNGAEFWLSSESSEDGSSNAESSKGGTVRMILIVDNPEQVFDKALKAGARQVYPVSESHGWKIGRLADPFGHHWEIGHIISH